MKTLKKLIDRQRRHERIRAKIVGTHEKPRLVVYRSLDHHFAQLVDDTKGRTLVSASDLKHKDHAKKIGNAKNVGLQIAKLAAEKNITSCVFDRNGYKYHGRIKALAEGAREGGLKF